MSALSVDTSLEALSDQPRLIAIAGYQQEQIQSEAHRHSQGQLLGSRRGLLSVSVESMVWVVPASHAVWIPPMKMHAVDSHGPFDGWAVFLKESACAALPTVACTIPISGLLLEAVLRATSWPLGSHDAPSEAIASVIIDEIRTLPAESLALPLPSDPRLKRITQEFLADPACERDLQSWARFGAVSPRTLSRRFVLETGFTFTAWRQRARLLRSLEMLAAGLSVTTVAAELGYSTTSAFIALFRSAFGKTPSRYRLQLTSR